MRKLEKKGLLIITFIIFGGFLYARGVEKYVCSENVPMKAKPRVTSKTCKFLEYGDIVKILDEDKSWAFVEDLNGEKGYVHTSALTKKKIINSRNKVSANAEELALAGKGFNSSMENFYSDEFNIDYKKVDEIEKNEVSYESILDFMEEGNLVISED